jgi:very-short-patch-repair endonuclease
LMERARRARPSAPRGRGTGRAGSARERTERYREMGVKRSTATSRDSAMAREKSFCMPRADQAKKFAGRSGCTGMATHARFASREMFRRARELRRNATPQEKIIWELVRDHQLGYPVRRQHPLGKHIVDFYCPQAKLAIEIDGSQHGDYSDDIRDGTLAIEFGVKVIHFKNQRVNNDAASVVEEIRKAINERAPLLAERKRRAKEFPDDDE